MPNNGILIVDDHPGNTKLLSFLLVREGYDVRSAECAEEALQILQTFEPCVVLMDIQMPGMDGLELTKLLKADPTRCHIIIIAITASAMKGDEERAVAAGCDGYIAKPIDTRALPKIVARYFERA
jgi:two-component system, cell cycle response regulator DivK